MMPEREPTNHERRAGRPWDASYRDAVPPWDIGEPQPAMRRLAAAGAFRGAVLDAGCGTGENGLLVAALGLQVVGVDVAETAIAMAREKAAARGIEAEFLVADALHLERLGRAFDSVLDSGLFHSFEGEERDAYAASLARVTRLGALTYILCFADTGPGPLGPHPVGEDELRAPFDAAAWRVASIIPERIHATFAPDGVDAWLATIERIGALR